ncbi:hypothetical protein LEMLEM_LOCUS18338, partial [Lemmus lemmus]
MLRNHGVLRTDELLGLSKPTEAAASTMNIPCVVFAFRFPHTTEARFLCVLGW